jgi:hypothetical protein
MFQTPSGWLSVIPLIARFLSLPFLYHCKHRHRHEHFKLTTRHDLNQTNAWNMVTYGTRYCRLNFVVVERELSEKNGVSRRGVSKRRRHFYHAHDCTVLDIWVPGQGKLPI